MPEIEELEQDEDFVQVERADAASPPPETPATTATDSTATVSSDARAASTQPPPVSEQRGAGLGGSATDDAASSSANSSSTSAAAASKAGSSSKPSDSNSNNKGERASGMAKSKATDASAELDSGNSKDDDEVDMLGSGQLLKKTLRAGKIDTRPQNGDVVTVAYALRLAGSTEIVEQVDSATFRLGEGDTLLAIDLACAMLDIGELARIKAFPKFAYKEAGKPPGIPPNAHVEIELELKKVEMSDADAPLTSVESLLHALNGKKARGNELFGRGDWEEAINSYSRGLRLIEKGLARQTEIEETLKKLDDSEDSAEARKLLTSRAATNEERSELRTLHLAFLNNVATCQIKLELYHQALETVGTALKLDHMNIKALLRKAQALRYLSNFDEALAPLNLIMEAISPAQRPPSDVREELTLVKQLKKDADDKDRVVYRRMMEAMKRQHMRDPVAALAADEAAERDWKAWSDNKWRNPDFWLLWGSIVCAIVLAVVLRQSGVLDALMPGDANPTVPSGQHGEL
ncbi:hypothetical protein CAOG_01629 [Capsaspora owczarzaki ATCC 30864]|uniref:peptidylprolyl isomerase n=1 Tax=Capsaspora owczarzaki (strain ATCC 30864) TaxID=595528 RepID=A0A0D2WJM2_CAPO3|nr:hypothetical protein CAOG_01629 [Capsaspora owczarzaki ATCC 30864]KJE90295.1 hypothetical protein CAOG_001629 [Capsaspora owczarzaki ATCC 30864]|eukprot:XP_004364497.1 hypothetical protein CAOG_01629 [Capsaspora owczarzaki ATCC 30864]